MAVDGAILALRVREKHASGTGGDFSTPGVRLFIFSRPTIRVFLTPFGCFRGTRTSNTAGGLIYAVFANWYFRVERTFREGGFYRVRYDVLVVCCFRRVSFPRGRPIRN